MEETINFTTGSIKGGCLVKSMVGMFIEHISYEWAEKSWAEKRMNPREKK